MAYPGKGDQVPPYLRISMEITIIIKYWIIG